MGKAGKQRKHEGKMARKRAVKKARRDKYKSLAGTSKRAKRHHKQLTSSIHKHAHDTANCGNPGCKRCFDRSRPSKPRVPPVLIKPPKEPSTMDDLDENDILQFQHSE